MRICLDPGHGMGNRRSGVYDPGTLAAGHTEAAIAMEDRNQVLCSRSEEFNEGIRAFLEKRKPVYIRR